MSSSGDKEEASQAILPGVASRGGDELPSRRKAASSSSPPMASKVSRAATIDAISRHRETIGSFSEEASLGCDGHVWRGSWLVQCAAYVVAGAIRGDGSNIRYMYICTVVGRRMSKGRLILDLKRGHQQCDI